ncbi:hypothetical protein HanIR_Chr04g0195271 [Helianthus annuus]|nr:hypothetical protein HanIR_Chr04g0195271 [Helianthus annuus]
MFLKRKMRRECFFCFIIYGPYIVIRVVYKCIQFIKSIRLNGFISEVFDVYQMYTGRID